MMLTIGLTGGIGSGKSAVSSVLATLGATIVDADLIAREVVEPGTDGLREIVARFGEDLLDADGALIRPALASIVFNDEEALLALNRIVHPKVAARSQQIIADAGPDAVIVNDIPLLAEGGRGAQFHLVLVVQAPLQVRLERLVGTRGMAEDDARARIQAQATDEQRAAIADELIINDGSLEHLQATVRSVWESRLAPYAENLRRRRAAPGRTEPPARLARILERLRDTLEPLGAALAGGEPDIDVDAPVSGRDEIVTALEQAGWFETGDDGVRESADPQTHQRLRIRWNADL